MGLERIPEINKIEDREQRRMVDDIYNKALQNVIPLEAAPTTAGGELTANQIGSYDSDLYINVNGTIIKYTGTAT